MCREDGITAPLAIAHRAGNSLADLRAAEAAGVDLVEADIWLHRGRLEVRHEKTMGPAPLLWDRWRLSPGWTPRLTAATLLSTAATSTEMMLDLKGWARALPAMLIQLIEELAPDRRLTVCSPNWALVEPFHDVPNVRVVHSAGSERRLRRLLARLPTSSSDGVSIHARLLTPAIVGALRERVPVVMSWPINTRERLDRLAGWGVNGIISDNLALLQRLVDRRASSDTIPVDPRSGGGSLPAS